MILIQLVAVWNGDRRILSGVSVQDRWNLRSLFGETVIMDDRNSSGLKAARRKLVSWGMSGEFKLRKSRAAQVPHPTPSRRECLALGPALAEMAPGFPVSVYGLPDFFWTGRNTPQ